MKQEPVRQKSAIVIGGSLGGLFTGTALELAGWNVAVYERSTHDLVGRGGGIVLQPEVVSAFRQAGAETKLSNLGVQSQHRTVFNPDGSIRSKKLAPQTQTSWSMIYTNLRSAFSGSYQQGKVLSGVTQNHAAGTVTAMFEDGTDVTADLLVGADGNGSTTRQLLWPNSEPSYAGYLAWRGLMPEDEMPALAREALHGDFAFANVTGSHMLGYLVPGFDGDTRPGHRLYNFVWYRVADAETLADIMTDKDGRHRGFAMPRGKLADRWIKHLRDDADQLLPSPFRDLIHATEDPFAQAIRDLALDSMVEGRVALIGDAAFIPRPHTGAGTAKAAYNAMTLADALNQTTDVERALLGWEIDQIRLGRQLYREGTSTGDYLMFDKPAMAQVG